MKYKSLIIIFLLFGACKKDELFKIEGKVLNREIGTIVLTQLGENFLYAETCQLKNGEFHFEGVLESPEDFRIYYRETSTSNPGEPFTIFIEPSSKVNVVLHPDSMKLSQIKGTKIGKDFWNINQTINDRYFSKLEVIKYEFEIASKSNNSELLNDLQEKGDFVMNQIQDYQLDYIKENPNSFISAYFLYSFHLFLDADIINEYFKFLDSSLEESKYYQAVQSYLSVQVGNPYIDFELFDIEGNNHILSEIAKNKVVLIDFWASWCKPCREHNKNLVQLYNTYNSKEFEIVGVSIDRDTTNFERAIIEDNMNWLNLMDRSDKKAVSKIYRSVNVPFNILIDKNGTIAYRANNYAGLKVAIDSLLNTK